MTNGLEGWTRTGATHTEPCGCLYEQRFEPGAHYYHEGWLLLVRCQEHAKHASDTEEES